MKVLAGGGPRAKSGMGRAQRWLAPFTAAPYGGLGAATIVLVLVACEAIVRAAGVQPIVVPTPSLVVTAMWQYAAGGELPADLAATLRRLLLGLAIGMTLGVTLGLALAWYRRVRQILYPYVAVTFPIPKAALVPLIIIWFGKGDAYKLILVSVGVVYIALINTMAGVDGVSPATLMACRNLGANQRQIFQHVILPAIMPEILAALRLSFSLALVLTIISEMIVSADGLGHFIVSAGEQLKTESVFAGVLISGLLGVLGFQLIERLERWLLRWRKMARE